MSLIAMLFVVGALLLAAEVFVPGGILGILAALALVAGVIVAFVEHGWTGGWIALAAAMALTVITLVVEFMVLPRTRLGRRLFLHSEITGASQPPLAEAESIIGRIAVADTMLAPTGYVLVEGKRYEASSRSGLIAKGEALHVVGMDNFRLIVQKN